MKRSKRLWLVSFVISLAILSLAIYVFMDFMKNNSAVDNVEKDSNAKVEVDTQTPYIEPQDNVGAVSFTEDQVTELARKLFSLDGFLSDIVIDLKDGEIDISARIKDKEKLIEIYPELKKYDALLTTIENKKMDLSGGITNDDGRAAVRIDSVTVGDAEIDGDIIAPFIEMGDFSSLFDVEYQDIEISDGEVVFKNGVPDILKY